MKITVLIENTRGERNLLPEHGLSLYIETGEHRILFDAGRSTRFSANARILGVSLADVDFAVLSHGHYDHGNGFWCFMRKNQHAKIYVNPAALLPHYNASGKEIGVDAWDWEMDRVCFVEEPLKIAPGIVLVPGKEIGPPRKSGMKMLEGGRILPDDFRHEQYLLVEEQGKRILFTGCAHRGIVQILQCFQPDVVVGGFHTKDIYPDREGIARLTALAQRLEIFPTVYYTCHCTGLEQYRILKEQLGEQLHWIGTGDILTL